MKTLGIIGGMSWESTALYYSLINRGVRERLGGLHSASLLLSSYDFADVEKLQAAGEWKRLAEVLTDTAGKLVSAGARGILIATNTMHEVADIVEASIALPLLHIADAAGDALLEDDVETVGLLGTRHTMERPFYAERLREGFGIRALVPDGAGRDAVHRVIYEELCCGITDEGSRQIYRDVMADLQHRGAQGILLACTEIGMLVDEGDSDLPLYDTTLLHAGAAVEWMLE